MGDGKRMKTLAKVAFKWEPMLLPRPVEFKEGTGLPEKAVMFDLWRDEAEIFPSVWFAAWPVGPTWHGATFVISAESGEMSAPIPFEVEGPSDEQAPRWLFFAFSRVMQTFMVPTMLNLFDVDSPEDLPGELQESYNKAVRLGDAMRIIFQSYDPPHG